MNTVLVPPLLCSARVYDSVIDTVWSRGSVTVADTLDDATIPGMAARLLRDAPEKFALLGTSMGGTSLSKSPGRLRTGCSGSRS